MSPAVVVLMKLGVRLVVFTGVFWLAARRNKKIIIEKRWATPLVGLAFAVLNTALYWALGSIFNVATLGALSIAMPLAINAVLLGVTVRIFQRKPHWFRVDGWLAMLWMAVALTLAHGALWVAVDYLPKHV